MIEHYVLVNVNKPLLSYVFPTIMINHQRIVWRRLKWLSYTSHALEPY